MSSAILNSVTVPLEGINLIEAAAGTGKTYNIQNIVARMILEKTLPIDSIVVLSFTNEAAAELSCRIRKILDEILSLLENIPVKDPEQAQNIIDHDKLIHPETTTKDRIMLIRNALRDFDLARISTINGFCQKLLSEFAFESDLAFNSELKTDPDPIIVELLEDWMRSKFYDGGRRSELISALVSSNEIAKLKRYILDFNLVIPEYPEIDLAAELDTLIKYHTCSDELSMLDTEMFSQRSKFVRDQEKLQDALASNDYITILELADGFMPDKLESDALKDHKTEVKDIIDAGLFFKQYQRIHNLRGNAAAALKAEAIRFVRKQFIKLEHANNFMTYSDQIKLVHDALETSGELLEKLQKKFKAGIIDEFQDTDAMQYKIFKTMFTRPDCCIFMVGDPRQAIYRFRGGDINTYLRAKQDTAQNGHIYHLDINYRSSTNMVAEVNAIFANRPKPFGDIDIEFPELASRPPEKAPELLQNDIPAPRAMLRHCSVNGTPLHLLFAGAQRIVNLVSGSTNEKLPDNSPIRPGDIAVLLRTKSECIQMQTILEYYNIPAVCLKNGNIYSDIEAYALYQVLCGALEPASHQKVSTALAGFLCGIPLAELDTAVAANEINFTIHREKFHKMNQLWYQKGFAVMFEYFLGAFNVRENLASRPDGERRLTNLYQLGELLNSQAISSKMPPIVLSRKFGDLIAQADDQLYQNEENEEPMSSGDSAVRIMTVHASKGLQFPVVMLPGLQRLTVAPGRNEDRIFYNGTSRELNLNDNPCNTLIEHREIYEEKIRLIYVALTRSIYRCEVFESAALPDSVWNHLIMPVCDRLHSQPLTIESGFKRMPNHELTLINSIPETEDIHPDWQLTSYSALTGTLVSSGSYTGEASPVDHDEQPSADNIHGMQNESAFSPFLLPGGAGFGTALHEIFERADFAGTQSVFIHAANTLFKRSGNQQLCRQPGYPEAAGAWLYNIFHTPLTDCCGEQFVLAEIPAQDRIVETEFYCAIQDFDLKELRSALEEYVLEEFGFSIPQENWREFCSGGILNGFVDLIFRRNGKYYIADWKSNRLNGNPENFSPEHLTDAMTHSLYFLQYMFYLVALIRHLRHFNCGVFGETEYEKMIGGVYYLFVRGISPQHPQRGIFQSRPPWRIIQALEELICSKMS